MIEDHLTENVTRLIFQLAVILIVAKIGGEICNRYFKTPAVLGELTAGIIIGPFALGGIDLPYLGPLFGQSPSLAIPVSNELWAIAQIGSIILLFMAGIETDLRQFIKYAKQASLVASGGVILPFVMGVFLTMQFGFSETITDTRALFVGAVMTATSIGITVRVLSDLSSLNTPEGVTILGAAVLDDVLGILAITIVVGLERSSEFSATTIIPMALKAIGFWLALTIIGILLSKHISNLFAKFKVNGANLALSLSLAFLAAGLAESFGLAMIIGAFSIGLALSGTQLAHNLHIPLETISSFIVPIFFVVMGMLVDITSLQNMWIFGLIITIFAIIGKIVGSGVPALLTGFNFRGAWRIGIGMTPRGEVALIMASIGIAHNIIDTDFYGVIILMAILTTVIVPPILSISFRNNLPGTRKTLPN